MTPATRRGAGGQGPYRIEMEDEWSLQDLASFPSAYGQLYAFLYVIQRVDPEDGALNYPWKGGYSTVNFFSFARARVPRAHRPRLLSIRYSSPGWMELSLIIAVALSLRAMVKAFVSSARDLNQLYQEIYRGLHERRLMRIDVRERALQLRRAELAWIEEMAERMIRLLGAEHFEGLSSRMENPLARLKLLLSVFRRVKTLAEYELDGKAKL